MFKICSSLESQVLLKISRVCFNQSFPENSLPFINSSTGQLQNEVVSLRCNHRTEEGLFLPSSLPAIHAGIPGAGLSHRGSWPFLPPSQTDGWWRLDSHNIRGLGPSPPTRIPLATPNVPLMLPGNYKFRAKWLCLKPTFSSPQFQKGTKNWFSHKNWGLHRPRHT